MTKISPFKGIISFLLTLIIVIFIAYYFIYRDIAVKNIHVSSLSSGLSLQNVKQQYIATTTEYLKNIDNDLTNITNSIIPSGEDVKFIEDLESLARSDGLEIVIDSLSFEADKRADANGVVVLSVKAKTVGTWTGNYSFLTQLESLPTKVKVKNVTLGDKIDVSLVDSDHAPKPTDKWESSFEINVLKYK